MSCRGAKQGRMLEPGLAVAPAKLDLPDLPDAEFVLRLRAASEAPARDLAALLAEDLAVPAA